MGNRFHTRIEGTHINHTMGPVSTKLYDKFRLILRIETTVVNVSFSKHYREVEHRDGTRSMAWAEMKKTIYSLAPLRQLLLAANRRYLVALRPGVRRTASRNSACNCRCWNELEV
jgi:hypothetical protein